MSIATLPDLIATPRPVEDFDVDAICHSLNVDGFCVVPEVVERDVALAARDIMMAIADAEATDGSRQAKTQRVSRIALKHEAFMAMMCAPLSVAVWTRLLGTDMVCSTWTANIAHPGFDHIHWHVDFPFWSTLEPYPTATWLAGQTIWMLDDFRAENGGTGTVPGAHLRGHGPTDRTANPEGATIVTGTAGSVAFAHGAWWHTARPNSTDRSRVALLGMYARKILVTQEDMRSQLAQVENPTPLQTQLMCGNQHVPRNVLGY